MSFPDAQTINGLFTEAEALVQMAVFWFYTVMFALLSLGSLVAPYGLWREIVRRPPLALELRSLMGLPMTVVRQYTRGGTLRNYSTMALVHVIVGGGLIVASRWHANLVHVKWTNVAFVVMCVLACSNLQLVLNVRLMMIFVNRLNARKH